MCGIVGIVNFNGKPVSRSEIKIMTDAIAHRGPDGEGGVVNGSVGIGHRRLAIIDLSPAASQPMTSPDKSFILSYSGEIYNFRELRSELEYKNYQFITKSDTEVILHAYTEWGTDCLNKFNGMFAFVLWDKRKRIFFMARDRYGIKPLYYAFQDNTFFFASEQKAIISHPIFRKEFDYEALFEYFTFQNLFTDKTFFTSIKLFPAGSYSILSLDKQCHNLVINQYWDFSFTDPEHSCSTAEYSEELHRLFTQAVTRQLISDVEVGSYLSGGIDSGSITAIAAQNTQYIKTFTCGFDMNSISGLELSFDEREKAEYMSYLFKTEHYEIVLKSGDMERILPLLAWHIEEPRIGQSYPNYYIARLASKFLKVVLSGTGGDELFGGYPWRYYRFMHSKNFDDYIDKYYIFWQRLLPNTSLKSVFSPIWNQVKHVWTKDIFRDVFKHRQNKLSSPEDFINNSLYFEAKTFLHGLLIIEDKLSMANGLETRLPFLDNDLVDFAMTLPVKEKLRNLTDTVYRDENKSGNKQEQCYQQTKDGKLILRNVMGQYIPDVVKNAHKQGFSAPDSSWFRGDSLNYVTDLLFSKSAGIYNFFDYNTVNALITSHLKGKENRRLFIWSLLSFEWWLKKYM